MNVVNPVSIFVESQFPAFYKDEGPDFLAFVQSYYEWMELQNNATDLSRNIQNYRDVDKSIDTFVDHFRKEYLRNIPISQSSTDQAFLIKHIQDLYRAKGTPRAFDLVFRLFFGEDATIYYPKDDILKLSDGKWTVPVYLELSPNTRTADFIGKVITGTKSSATAFVENIIRNRINTRIFDVAFLSDVKGNFQYGEQITENGDPIGAPFVAGSLSEITVLSGGSNHSVGELLNVLSGNGVGGVARVASVSSGTGQVSLGVLDGGWGFTTDANTQIEVSNTVLTLLSANNALSSMATVDFIRWENVVQPLVDMTYGVWTGNTVASSLYNTVTGYANATSNGAIASGTIININNSSNTLTVCSTGNWGNSSYFVVSNTSNTSTFTLHADTSVVNTSISANVVASSTNGAIVSAVGINNVANANTANGNINFFTGPNAFVYGGTSNTYASIASASTGNYAAFKIGSLTDVETISLYSDRLVDHSTTLYNQNNSPVVLSSVTIDGTKYVSADGTLQNTKNLNGNGSFSNTSSANTAYGFSKAATANLNTVMDVFLSTNNYSVGSIQYLTSVNHGSNYNNLPFISVVTPVVAGIDRRNSIVNYSINVGAFITGETVYQNIPVASQSLTLSGNTYSIVIGEAIGNAANNANANTIGTVLSVNGNTYIVAITNGTAFANNDTLRSYTSNTSANTISVAVPSTSNVVVTGEILSCNSLSYTLEVRPKSLTRTFVSGGNLYGSTSGTDATILSAIRDDALPSVGFNSYVSNQIHNANGVVQTLNVIDSGLGFLDGEVVNLVTADKSSTISGSVVVSKQGIGDGYFNGTHGFLNSDKYMHDNEYYQEYSYEVQVGMSLDRYADILKEVFHVSGTALFGDVIRSSTIITNSQAASATVIINN